MVTAAQARIVVRPVGGGVLLFAYSLYRKDPVFIAGQGLGLFVYLRNLYFVLREKKQGQIAA